MSKKPSFKPVSRLKGFSMWPTIKPGQKIVFSETSFSALKEGDIIRFQDEISGQMVCHRIVERITEDGKTKYKTKGDNNRFRDRGFVTTHNYYGRAYIIGSKYL